MDKKSYLIKSDFLGGNVFITEDDTGCDVQIDVKIYGNLDADSVIRAYFASKDTKEIKSIGIIDNFGSLSKKADPSIVTDTIVFILKNTLTDKKETVGYAYYENEWTLEENNAVDNAKKVLDEIKSDCVNDEVDTDLAHKNILDEINRNLKDYGVFQKNILDEFDVYKICDFRPMSSISSVKYTMFEKNAIYSFDYFSHYLFGINGKKILIAFASQNGINPLMHLSDLCTQFECDNLTYYAVIIELCDDGQYFIKD